MKVPPHFSRLLDREGGLLQNWGGGEIMPVTVYDIAKAAGVSRTTVKRALTGEGRISPETMERIKRIAEEMKYRPNHSALRLTRGKTNLVGVVNFPAMFAVTQMVFEPISRRLHEIGYETLFYTSSGYPEDTDKCLDQLLGNRVAGAIMITGPGAENISMCCELMENGVKLVVIDAVLEGLSAPQIIHDQYATGRLVTEHLLSLGHRKIAYLAIPKKFYIGRERERGFTDAMASTGLEGRIEEVDFSEESGYAAASTIMSGPNPPTAIVARHDIVAMGAMNAILSAGLSIPGDVSLVGAAGLWFSHMLRVPLTTVVHSPSALAEAAVEKLGAMLGGEDVPSGIETVGVKLVVRDSSGLPKR